MTLIRFHCEKAIATTNEIAKIIQILIHFVLLILKLLCTQPSLTISSYYLNYYE